MIIGVSGVAGAGKDLFVETCIKEFEKLGKTGKRFALASALKHEVRDWCLEHYGIDSVNCPREDKEKIRSFLVAHGTTKRHASQGRHWVEQLQTQIEEQKNNYDYLFISDLRYADYPKDETYWLKEELDGKLVHISQYKIEPRLNGETKIFRPPVNEEERRNEPMLEEEADYILQWEFNTDMMNKDTYIASKVNEFINWLSSYKE
jgi:hypothetical protein